MRISDIINEDTTTAVMASVIMPMTPGTKPNDARKAVDPYGYGPNKKRKKKKNEESVTPTMIRRVYPNE